VRASAPNSAQPIIAHTGTIQVISGLGSAPG
jgi:hypothetical protein